MVTGILKWVISEQALMPSKLQYMYLSYFNPLVMNGLSQHYKLAEFTVIFRVIRSHFEFLFKFSMKFLRANRKAPDGMPRSVASHLGLFSLPMSHKQNDRIKGVKGMVVA